MEPYWNSLTDDTEAIMRSVRRREKLNREKKRRQRRNIMLGICSVLLVVIVLVLFFSLCGKDSKENENQGEEIPVSKQEEEEIIEEESVPEEPEVINAFRVTAETNEITSENMMSANAILIDASNDTIVAAKAARVRMSPASMTKVLTVLVAAELIPEENLNDTFTMTLEITDYSYVNGCSCVGFLDGEDVSIIDMFYGTIMSSGADAALGLATYVAGTHEAFVELMNQKLEELGIAESSHFTNCVGIYDENHYSTAYDMAVIMKAALENDLCKKVLGERVYNTNPTEEHPEGLTISNWFIRRIEDKETGGLVLGAKTGYVVESGNCAVSWGEFAGGTPYICVTAGSISKWQCIRDHVDIYMQYAAE